MELLRFEAAMWLPWVYAAAMVKTHAEFLENFVGLLA
jgi:hypothetical protein